MLRIIIIVTVVFASLGSFSQTRYYGPNFYCSYLMDSLQIPYLPLDMRVSRSGFSESFKQRFIEMFGNDLSYIPSTSLSDLPIELFVFKMDFVSERDSIYHQLMAGFEYNVISKSIVPLTDSIHKSIWIVEIYGKATDQFNVVMYFENHDGRFQTIFQDFLPIPPGGISQIDYE